MPISPDETAFQALPSGETLDSPNEKPLRLARQFHFGSQCTTERVYQYLSAKVELTKSHFGKPPLTESALLHQPCQSELAEPLRAGNRKSRRKTKKGRTETFGPTRRNLKDLLLEQECYTDVELIMGSGGVVDCCAVH